MFNIFIPSPTIVLRRICAAPRSSTDDRAENPNEHPSLTIPLPSRTDYRRRTPEKHHPRNPRLSVPAGTHPLSSDQTTVTLPSPVPRSRRPCRTPPDNPPDPERRKIRQHPGRKPGRRNSDSSANLDPHPGKTPPHLSNKQTPAAAADHPHPPRQKNQPSHSP